MPKSSTRSVACSSAATSPSVRYAYSSGSIHWNLNRLWAKERAFWGFIVQSTGGSSSTRSPLIVNRPRFARSTSAALKVPARSTS